MLIFLDTETTGLEQGDKICSIAIRSYEGEEQNQIYELVNEGKKIPPLASSINHITNEMIKGKKKLIDSDSYRFLQDNNLESTIIVGHNIRFDLLKLQESGFDFKGKIIDTMRVTKHLIPECEMFSLQFLRYELKLYKKEKENLQAHNALSDVILTNMLYDYLLDFASCDDMIELSSKSVLMQKLEFGKYSGRYIEEISMSDRSYLEWMLLNVVDMDEDLRYSINYYLSFY